MEVVNEIKKSDELEVFTKEEQDDLFMQLVRGKDVTEKVETSRGEFIVKYPKQKDMISIGRLTAYKHRNLNVNCFDEDTEAMIKITSYLEVCVVDGPAWYKNARNEKSDWSWEDIPDSEFITDLFVKAQTFRQKVASTFTKNAESKTDRVSTDTSDTDTLDNGLFSDIAGSKKS